MTIYTPLLNRLLETFGENLKAAVLFGSRARGRVKNSADHDIFLVVEGLPADPLLRVRTIRKAIWDLDLNVNTIAKTPKEFSANLTPLFLEIAMDGICLYGENYFEPYRVKAKCAAAQGGLKRVWVGKEWHWEFDRVLDREWELSWDGFRELQR